MARRDASPEWMSTTPDLEGKAIADYLIWSRATMMADYNVNRDAFLAGWKAGRGIRVTDTTHPSTMSRENEIRERLNKATSGATWAPSMTRQAAEDAEYLLAENAKLRAVAERVVDMDHARDCRGGETQGPPGIAGREVWGICNCAKGLVGSLAEVDQEPA